MADSFAADERFVASRINLKSENLMTTEAMNALALLPRPSLFRDIIVNEDSYSIFSEYERLFVKEFHDAIDAGQYFQSMHVCS